MGHFLPHKRKGSWREDKREEGARAPHKGLGGPRAVLSAHATADIQDRRGIAQGPRASGGKKQHDSSDSYLILHHPELSSFVCAS